jgi:hypothetical protein
MPKIKTTTVKETLPEDGFDLETSSFAGVDDDFLLAKIHEDYPDSQIRQKVYKGGVFQFATTEKIDEEMCQQYGGGKYEIRFIVNGKPIHKIYYEVAEPVKKNGAPVNDAASIQNQMLRDQLQWNQQMILALMGKPGPVTTPTPMSDLISAWTVLQGGAKQFDPTNLIIKGIELADKVSGKGDNGDWKVELFKTLREVAPAVMHAAGAQPQPNGAQPMIAAVTPEDEVLRQGLTWLKSRILAGFPVELALDWLIANANDPQYQPFIKMGLQKTFEDVVKIDNEFVNEPYNSWTRALIDGIKGWAQSQSQPPENEDDQSA